MTRNIFIVGFAAGILGLAVACSDSDEGSSSGGNNAGTSSGASGTPGSSGTSGSPGSSGTGFKNCSVTSGTTCTEADLKPYADCLKEKCDATYKKCYGADYESGSFTGPCGTFLACTQKCDCNDTQCVLACKMDDACQACAGEIGTCTDACSSAEPECSKNGSSGGEDKTCADLQACCDAIADADQKAGCQAAKDTANGDDAQCSQLYTGFKALCP